MGDNWRTTTLEALGRIVTGKTPPTSAAENYGGSVPFVTPSDMDGRRKIDRTQRSLTEHGVESVRNAKIPAGAIMVSCIGSDMGKAAIAARACVTNQQINSVIVETDDNPLFVFYNLYARRTEIRSIASGSAQPILNKSAFGRLTIHLPEKNAQAASAEVLGTLDDLIESNSRVNRTLEQIARTIFNHEFHPLPGSELPKHWTIGQLGDLVDLMTERVDPTPQKDAEKYIALDDMPSKSVNLDSYRMGSEVNSSIIRFRRGDILFGSMRPYFHKVGIAPFDGITRTTTFVLRPKRPELRTFALFVFSSNEVVEYSTSASVGTTIPYIKWDSLQRYPVAIPPRELLGEFTERIQPMLDLMHAANEESRTLAETRDFLLPRLLSGEVNVEALLK